MTFFARMEPAQSIAKPACMKNTSAVEKRRKMVLLADTRPAIEAAFSSTVSIRRSADSWLWQRTETATRRQWEEKGGIESRVSVSIVDRRSRARRPQFVPAVISGEPGKSERARVRNRIARRTRARDAKTRDRARRAREKDRSRRDIDFFIARGGSIATIARRRARRSRARSPGTILLISPAKGREHDPGRRARGAGGETHRRPRRARRRRGRPYRRRCTMRPW